MEKKEKTSLVFDDLFSNLQNTSKKKYELLKNFDRERNTHVNDESENDAAIARFVTSTLLFFKVKERGEFVNEIFQNRLDFVSKLNWGSIIVIWINFLFQMLSTTLVGSSSFLHGVIAFLALIVFVVTSINQIKVKKMKREIEESTKEDLLGKLRYINFNNLNFNSLTILHKEIENSMLNVENETTEINLKIDEIKKVFDKTKQIKMLEDLLMIKKD